MRPRVLVAGVGNVFLGDDGFGVEVARRLAHATWGDADVVVRDVGVRTLHLAYDLLEGWDLLVVVDAVATGAAPGTLHLIEPEAGGAKALRTGDTHGMDLDDVLHTARALGASTPRVLLVACDVADVDERMGLTPAVEASLDAAVDLVASVVRDHAGQPLRHTDQPRAEVTRETD